MAFTDGVTAALQVALVLGIAATLAAGTKRSLWPAGQLVLASVGAIGLVVALLGVPAVAKSADHGGADHHGTEEAAGGHGHGGGDEHSGMTDAEMAKHGDAPHTEAKPYDPTQPIDLSGTPGVSPAQQAEAENLIAVTLDGLPQWADPAYAETKGFRSIGDGGTGVEHLVNQSFMDDDTLLDPDAPESLVFSTEGGERRLVAAMYMTKPGTPLADVPKIGGPLLQWHVTTTFATTPRARSGHHQREGRVPEGLTKPVETPMVHVWIESHPCGPFAALEGIVAAASPRVRSASATTPTARACSSLSSGW